MEVVLILSPTQRSQQRVFVSSLILPHYCHVPNCHQKLAHLLVGLLLILFSSQLVLIESLLLLSQNPNQLA